MKVEKHIFRIKQAMRPIVEIDTQTNSVYVRFKKTKITRTVAQPAKHMHVAVDLDAHDEVVGFEVVGVTRFDLNFLLKAANVMVPNLDFAEARYVSSELVAA